jgi:hypothetical protein
MKIKLGYTENRSIKRCRFRTYLGVHSLMQNTTLALMHVEFLKNQW